MYEYGTIWRRPFPFLCVALRASTSAATVLEWDVSASAGGVLYKVPICGVMAVVCVSKELLVLRAYIRSRRRKVRGVRLC